MVSCVRRWKNVPDPAHGSANPVLVTLDRSGSRAVARAMSVLVTGIDCRRKEYNVSSASSDSTSCSGNREKQPAFTFSLVGSNFRNMCMPTTSRPNAEAELLLSLGNQSLVQYRLQWFVICYQRESAAVQVAVKLSNAENKRQGFFF